MSAPTLEAPTVADAIEKARVEYTRRMEAQVRQLEKDLKNQRLNYIARVRELRGSAIIPDMRTAYDKVLVEVLHTTLRY